MGLVEFNNPMLLSPGCQNSVHVTLSSFSIRANAEHELITDVPTAASMDSFYRLVCKDCNKNDATNQWKGSIPCVNLFTSSVRCSGAIPE